VTPTVRQTFRGQSPEQPTAYYPGAAMPVHIEPAPSPPRRWQDPVLWHAVALLLTVISTTFFGAWHWAAFVSGSDTPPGDPSTASFWIGGLVFSAPVLAILGAHELGHYLACRYYDVDASLPWFIPAPLPLTGTLGAFIRLREPIPHARALFDIAVAGPLAGFVVAVPLLVAGIAASRVVPLPAGPEAADRQPELGHQPLGERQRVRTGDEHRLLAAPDTCLPRLRPGPHLLPAP